MIDIILSNKSYENDVYPLVKAFHPEETIKVYETEEYHQRKVESSERKAQGSQLIEHNKDTDEFDELSRELRIEFNEDCIRIQYAVVMGNSHVQDQMISATTQKSEYKNALKRFLYAILSEATHRTLPWGILTGIRPTKLVYEMLEQGKSESFICKKMKEEYFCSEAKIAMSLRIARREIELLKEMDYKNGYSLYIGIPFCPSTCLYCSFTSYSITKYSDYVEAYLTALEKEIEYGATCFPGKKLTTVYFGGGTPTTLTAKQLDHLLGLVKKHFDFTYVKEFCVEAGRPDSITREKLEVLKKWGVDRISINPQSMQQKTLDLIGRRHSVEEIIEAFHLARETGHQNINMDIIIGLPGENPADVADTLTQIKALNPDSLTVHTLALKRAARLNIEKKNYADLKASEVSDMLEKTIHFAEENNYLPYYLYRQKNMADNLENIGYSRYGQEGLYNILIMEEQQTILALGAGGMSKFVFHEENRIERVDNVKSVLDYISRIEEMIARKQQFLNNNEVR
jgi:oxygen-independent coproporphyrinogen-3 oxidase